MKSKSIGAFLFALLVSAIATARAENHSDIWWNPGESGWGVTIADHETNIFAVLYHYDASGRPAWWVIPGGSFSQNGRIFQGDVYATSGPPYTSATFDTTTVTVTKVGSATFDFAPASLAAGTILFTYAIGATTRTKQLQRQPFGSAAASWGSDWTDLWFNQAESGWGLSVSQHGNNVFAVWYTYDANRSPIWFVIPGGTLASSGFSGRIYQTTGPGIGVDVFDPARVVVTDVGTAAISLGGKATAASDKSGGDFTPCIHGNCFHKLVTPQPFGNAAPARAAGTCVGTYTASIFFPLCPGGGFTAHANGAFTTQGVNYEQQGVFAGQLRLTLPNVYFNADGCSQDGTYFPDATAFNGFMNLSRIGQADFTVHYGDFNVPIHTQFSVGTSTVLGTLSGDGVTGRFSCSY